MKKKTKGIFIENMEKPNCCFDCPFILKDSIATKNIGYYKIIYNCKFIPEDEEDGWQDMKWAMNNVQSWCPIRKMEV